MIDLKELTAMAEKQGFSHTAFLDCSTIELRPEVRQMCELSARMRFSGLLQGENREISVWDSGTDNRTARR